MYGEENFWDVWMNKNFAECRRKYSATIFFFEALGNNLCRVFYPTLGTNGMVGVSVIDRGDVALFPECFRHRLGKDLTPVSHGWQVCRRGRVCRGQTLGLSAHYYFAECFDSSTRQTNTLPSVRSLPRAFCLPHGKWSLCGVPDKWNSAKSWELGISMVLVLSTNSIDAMLLSR